MFKISHTLGALAFVGVVTTTIFLSQGGILGLRSSSLGGDKCSIETLDSCSNEELDILEADLTAQIEANTQSMTQLTGLIQTLDTCFANPNKDPKILTIQNQLKAIEVAEQKLNAANSALTMYEFSKSNTVIDQGKPLSIFQIKLEISRFRPITAGTPQVTHLTTVTINNQRIIANTQHIKKLTTDIAALKKKKDTKKVPQLEADIGSLTRENASITRLNLLQSYLTKLTSVPVYTKLSNDVQAQSKVFLTLAGPNKSTVTGLNTSMKKLQETCEAALLKAYKIASRGDFYEKIAEAGAENERLSEEKGKVVEKKRIRAVPIPMCGNGIVEESEECDDGNYSNSDSCDTTCKNTASSTSVCGNGIIESPEECDSGGVTTDSCTSTCMSITLAPPPEGCPDPHTTRAMTCTNEPPFPLESRLCEYGNISYERWRCGETECSNKYAKCTIPYWSGWIWDDVVLASE